MHQATDGTDLGVDWKRLMKAIEPAKTGNRKIGGNTPTPGTVHIELDLTPAQAESLRKQLETN